MPVSRRLFLGGTLGWSTTLLLAACGQSATAPSTSASARGSASASSSGSAPASAKPAASAAAAASASPSGAANAVKAAWVAITANQMIWPVAKEAGYFDKYDVNFSLEYVQGSLTSIQALQAGDLQMVEVAGSAVVGARAPGTDVVMTAGFLNYMPWHIMALPSITSVDQLKGATVAITKVGNADQFAWYTLAERQGWQPTDFKYAPADNPPGQIALMSRGDAQAAAFSPPNEVLAQEKAKAHLVLDETQLHIPEQGTGMVLSRSYLSQNRPLALNVLKASVEAIHRWKTDPAFVKQVLAKYLKQTDQQYIDDGYSAYDPLWPEQPYPTEPGFAQVIKEVATQNPKASNVKPGDCIDSSLVKELVDSSFIQQIYGSSASASAAPASASAH